MENFHTLQDGKKYFFQVEPDEFGMKVHSVVFANKLHLFPLTVDLAETKEPLSGKSYQAAIKKAKAKHGVSSVIEHPRLVARIKKVGPNVELTAVNVTDNRYMDGSTDLLAILKT